MSDTHDYGESDIVSVDLMVGLEIHVELATRTKMFTRTPNVAHPEFQDAAPNTLVDPIVMALPGALPSMNAEAVDMSMRVGMALNCTIPDECRWDRKNYFYPDMPKGYQISQYDLPLCADGFLDIDSADGSTTRIGIIRAHLEEDAGKLGHETPDGATFDGSLVDLNRAGTPLLEIVTAPDFTAADDVVTFARELHAIVCFLGVTQGVMQRGHMRFEPNVNLTITTKDGRTHATPIVEMKNLNSFRAVKAAIEYETSRQRDAWIRDGQVQGSGMKVTRGWNDERGVTFVQREKEDAHDYRYFPEPDLVPVVINDAWRERIRETIPELPRARRQRYQDDFGLSARDAEALAHDAGVCAFYEACIDSCNAVHGAMVPSMKAGRECAKLLLNAGARRANEKNASIDTLGISPDQVACMLVMREQNDIGSSNLVELFDIMCDAGDSAADPRSIAEQRDMLQVMDEHAMDAWIDDAIAAEPNSAADFAAGKDAAAGRLIGAVMKASKGTADAAAVRERLISKLR